MLMWQEPTDTQLFLSLAWASQQLEHLYGRQKTYELGYSIERTTKLNERGFTGIFGLDRTR